MDDVERLMLFGRDVGGLHRDVEQGADFFDELIDVAVGESDGDVDVDGASGFPDH